jgi:hypothetical protein
MARLQILELPECADDDRPPFVLVVDQTVPQRIALGADAPYRDYWHDLAQQIGARGVIVTPETVDIPANDTTAYLDSEAEARAEPQRADERAIQAEEKLKAFMEKRYTIEQERKASLTDALGMDRLRDWDDIRNAAAGLRKERDSWAASAQRVRDLHRPVEHRGQTICWACSDYDFPGQTTDSPPVAYDQCLTIKALTGYPAADA